MIRLSRITDYGIVLMVRLAQNPDDEARNARNLAAETGLPVPVVSKVLKTLAREGLLSSQRGSKGGYALARSAGDISVPEMITALEGPISLTECSAHPRARRSCPAMCANRGNGSIPRSTMLSPRSRSPTSQRRKPLVPSFP